MNTTCALLGIRPAQPWAPKIATWYGESTSAAPGCDQLVDDARQQRGHRLLPGREQRVHLAALRDAATVGVEQVVALDDGDGLDVRGQRGGREQAGDAAAEDERGSPTRA